MGFSKCIFQFLTTSLLLSVTAWAIHVDFEKVDSPTGSQGQIVYHLRSTRMNRTTYVIVGNVTMKPEVTKNPNNYQINTDIYFSSMGNNQYTLTPYRLPERRFCDFLNTDYRKFAMPSLKGHSDAPISDDDLEDLCQTLFKPTDEGRFYEVNNVIFDTSAIPANAAQGFYKFDIRLSKLPFKTLDSQLEVIARLY